MILERRIDVAVLPPAVRAGLPAIAPDHAITLVEEVVGTGARYYEIYYRFGGRDAKAEVAPDGTPWNGYLRPDLSGTGGR